ncbi:MAG TPA: SDR family NAD(P)-dependent oxidoreductase, partial [Actinomycetota bacterium]
MAGQARRIALITGASRGLGLALARALASRGWELVVDARGADDLERAAAELPAATVVRAIPGDVTDPEHRQRLVDEARSLGGLHLLVNNASRLGPSPQPRLDRYPLPELRRVYEANVLAPLGLIQRALPLLRESNGRILDITSDAGVEGSEEWGGYGSSK